MLKKNARHQRLYVIRFHFYESIKGKFVETESIFVVAWGYRGEQRRTANGFEETF